MLARELCARSGTRRTHGAQRTEHAPKSHRAHSCKKAETYLIGWRVVLWPTLKLLTPDSSENVLLEIRNFDPTILVPGAKITFSPVLEQSMRNEH